MSRRIYAFAICAATLVVVRALSDVRNTSSQTPIFNLYSTKRAVTNVCIADSHRNHTESADVRPCGACADGNLVFLKELTAALAARVLEKPTDTLLRLVGACARRSAKRMRIGMRRLIRRLRRPPRD